MTDMQLLGLLVALVAAWGVALAEVPAIKNIRVRYPGDGYQPDAPSGTPEPPQGGTGAVQPTHLRRVK